jgi:hypothetical protein
MKPQGFLVAFQSDAARRRRLHGIRFELQRSVENVLEGVRKGCLPYPWAAVLIARIAKRGVSGLRLPVSHVR